MSCCKKLKCFSTYPSTILREKIYFFVSLSKMDRRSKLTTMESTDRCFYRAGRRVWGKILNQAFHFSNELQSCVCTYWVTTSKLTIMSDRNRWVVSIILEMDRLPQGRDTVVCFLEKLAENFGDSIPDRAETRPPFSWKNDVDDLFAEEPTRLQNVAPPTISSFGTTWRPCCLSIKTRKMRCFSRCAWSTQGSKTSLTVIMGLILPLVWIARRKQIERTT